MLALVGGDLGDVDEVPFLVEPRRPLGEVEAVADEPRIRPEQTRMGLAGGHHIGRDGPTSGRHAGRDQKGKPLRMPLNEQVVEREVVDEVEPSRRQVLDHLVVEQLLREVVGAGARTRGRAIGFIAVELHGRSGTVAARGGEQGHLVAPRHQLLGQGVHHPLDTAVAHRRGSLVDGGDHRHAKHNPPDALTGI